jgi:hypothetical protein
MLDVGLQPKDTTQFHIHSTPSVFLNHSTTNYITQIKGGEWIKEQSLAGKSWYRSFSPDTLIHRVSNCDSIPLHVTDMEILSSYHQNKLTQSKLLNFPVLYNNENVVAYQLTNENINRKTIKGRGPIMAELINGDKVIYHNTKNQSKELKAGGFQYIEPNTNFYFVPNGKTKISMILFEIK